MKEIEFVEKVQSLLGIGLSSSLQLRRGEALLYRAAVDNKLQWTADPRNPTRGQSAFETDLCLFETGKHGFSLPRVVLEFKIAVSTHDVLTYDAKASKHKQVYPYLRYGLVCASEPTIPGRVFMHSQSLDFFVAAGSFDDLLLAETLRQLLNEELEASRNLERMAFGDKSISIFRTEVILRQKRYARRMSLAAAQPARKHGINEEEAQPLTGLTLDELRLASFVKILKTRRT